MPKRTHFPGFELAQRIMTSATRDFDELFNDALDGCDIDDPETGTRRKRPSPDLCLDALMILRLMSCHEAAGAPAMLPQPGTVTLLSAGNHDDMTRLHSLIERLNSDILQSGKTNPQHLVDLDIIVQPRAGASELELRRFNESIRDSVFRGKPVMLIVANPAVLTPAILQTVTSQLHIAPASPQMFDAILKLLFPKHKARATKIDLGGITALQLARVFAADTAAKARAALQELKPAAPKDATAPALTLDKVHGQPNVVEAFSQVISDLEEWTAGNLAWSDVTSSFLLYGPPGTGKTLLAQALAGSAGLPLVQTSYSDCQRAGHQGDMLRELNSAFEKAINAAPSVLFIDEIDSFYSRSGSGGTSLSGYIVGVVNGLLTQIDKANATPGVILVAASNFAERVDPAILRPGRLDQHLCVGPLDRKGVMSLVRSEIPDILTAEELDMIADQLVQQTGATIAMLIRGARTRARRARQPLNASHVFAAAADVAPVPDPDVLHRVAIHEAGHIVMGQIAGLSLPRQVALAGAGGAIIRPMPELITPNVARGLIQMHLGGRAAELLCFDEVSNGSGGSDPACDLALATSLATRMHLNFGFEDTLFWDKPDQRIALSGVLRNRIDESLRKAEATAKSALAQHRPALLRLADALLEKRELQTEEIADLLWDVEPSTSGATDPDRATATA